VPVFLRDVAEIRTGVATRQGLAQKDGRAEAVGGIVMMLKGENSLQVVGRVREKVAEINAGTVLPAGLKLVPFYDRSEIVGKSIQTVSHALLVGALLVLAVLYMFLRSFRAAVVVVLALPLSLLLTFIVMRWAGLDANLMSLGGLAISIGMIIDATIIQVENVQRYLAQADDARPKVQRVLRAVMEVRKPSIFGELIIALTFLPILTLQGMEGKMFTPLAYTVAIALFASLFLSIFVIPGLCGLFLKPHPEKESPILRLAQKMYLPLLSTGLRSRLVILGVSLAAVLGAMALIPRLGSEFMPVMDEGAFDMDIQMLPGVSLSEAAAVTGQVQDRLMKFPELQHAVSKTGQTGISLEARGLDRSAFQGNFVPREKWRKGMTKEKLIDGMRDALADIPGIAYSFSQPIQCRIDELVAGTRAQVIVKLFGEDLDALRHQADRLAHLLSEVPGCTDLVVEKISGQPYINIQVDREKIARYGLNVADVLGVVETAIGGKSSTEIYEGNRAFDLVVRFPEERRNSAEAMGNILIRSGNSSPVPLGQLADIRVTEGPVQISRENGQRRIGIELNVSGRDIGGFVAEAQRRIRRELQLPTGTYVTWGGQFENQRQAMDRLMIITPLVVCMILLLLFLTFRSLRQALLVVAVLPFALAGGVFALTIAGMYMSVPASVGFIVLFGVAVLNSLVLVARVSQLRDEGVAPAEAVRGACENRLRPILMTASITVFSLMPLLFATGPGSEVQRPLAAVVVGGLITSTLATLLALPAMYPWFDRRDST
jgi:cobalt-zinc-cadmium resistance protein CzcA